MLERNLFLPMGIVLTEGQIAIYLALITAIAAPFIKEYFDYRKVKKQAASSEESKRSTDDASVKIAEMSDDADTRAELWKEVRFLRQDFNQISLAYAQLQHQYAQCTGEVRYMSLQIQHLESEIVNIRLNDDKIIAVHIARIVTLESENNQLRQQLLVKGV